MSTEIRSVQRALLVLRAMNEQTVWTLHELHQRTGVPKSSLHRLLCTLERERYVRTDPQVAGCYFLTREVAQLSRGITEKSALAEAAAPLMIATTREIRWPLSLGVIDEDRIRVVFCTMPYSPYAIRPSSTGRRYDMMKSALGRAYLANCPQVERRIIVEACSQSEGAERSPIDVWAMRRVLRETRALGYAIRYAGSTAESTTFAVPVFDDHGLRGVLGYSTYSRLMNPRMLQRFLPIVQATAKAIGAAALPLQEP
jgi:IclR family mhp operon transcriptional activator